jgi:hypothetical protein
LASKLGAPLAEVRAGLGALGAAGRLGYDLAHEAFFHRELPFDRSTLEAMHPRLIGARQLVEQRAVELVLGGTTARVTSGGVEYSVRFEQAGARCTCPWFARHAGSRGPCKHVLAADLARASSPVS